MADVVERGWKRRFDQPIPLPRGRQLVTLQDAGNYITKLPKAEHEAPEWQAAMEALILVATLWRADDVRADRHHAGIEPPPCSQVRSGPQAPPLGKKETQEGPMTIWITCWVRRGLSVGLSSASALP